MLIFAFILKFESFSFNCELLTDIFLSFFGFIA